MGLFHKTGRNDKIILPTPCPQKNYEILESSGFCSSPMTAMAAITNDHGDFLLSVSSVPPCFKGVALFPITRSRRSPDHPIFFVFLRVLCG
jgi:hypothetical protein